MVEILSPLLLSNAQFFSDRMRGNKLTTGLFPYLDQLLAYWTILYLMPFWFREPINPPSSLEGLNCLFADPIFFPQFPKGNGGSL
jgi:hypothetical protein